MSDKDSTPKPELLPCPFCGGKAALQTISSFSRNRFFHYVACNDPSCDVGTAQYRKKTQAAVRWNRRA